VENHLRTALPNGVSLERVQLSKDVQGRDRYAFDPVATVNKNQASFPNIQNDLDTALNNFYQNDQSARDHRTVMNSIETTRNKISAISCGI
jgi:hypothetical protein